MIVASASLQLASSHPFFALQNQQETSHAWWDDPTAKDGRRELEAGGADASLQRQISAARLAASHWQTRFAFDTAAGGKVEHVPFVGSSDGSLALDRHGNDGNGRIDENVPIHAHLLAWRRNASGAGLPQSLAQSGIGAIALDHTGTPFAPKDAGSTLQGAVRVTGIYLHEDDSSGTLQRVDLVA